MDWWNSLYVLVPVVAIAGGITYSIMKAKYRAMERTAELSGASDLKAVVEQNTAVNRQLLEKLEGLEGRLANVEKTLNEIP
ncbi:hypothetical protein OSC27_07650 [Microbacterium sp. STN6]|uniref:hypothetical protein n=1 Tax=Microbacterium sp. STN6 TaxID=2995588 RepID=UPI0022609832|nr:hypothetical protein [Microbacterium sp. STN6]MCX7522152.1 hypothetical protein [Microbacterium sp. STN6]